MIMTRIIDTHCHIQFNAYKDDFDEVISVCRDKNTILNAVGTQKNTSKKAVEFAEKYDDIYATIGLHPVHLFPTHIDEEEDSFVSREEDFDEEYYGELAKSEKVIAVGETGLDFFHLPKDVDRKVVVEKQKEIFTKQYQFAKKHNLPLVIHVRDAYDEMIELLTNLERSERSRLLTHVQRDSSVVPLHQNWGVIHCYSSNWTNAEKFLKLGLHLGFTGIVTFPPKKTDPKPQEELLEVLEKCPLDRMLVETDSPYLAPQKYRGERCEPWMVEEVTKKIAEVKKIPEDEVREQTLKNALGLFVKIKK